MQLNSRLLKSFNSIAISAGLLGLFSYVNPAKATPALCKDKLTQTTVKENIFSENNSATATALASSNYYCLGSPDRFELVIYEMGLCTSNPISGTPKTFSKDNCVTTMTSTGTTADLAGKTVNLPSASTRPANATYTHAFMTILNEFGLKGSISLAGTVYYSNSTGGVSTNSADLSNHTEELDSFGDSFDPDFGPETMPTGGKVSALLTDNSLTRAANAAAVTRLVAVFETNSGSPVVISDAVNGVEVELQVADGGYGIMFNNSGVPEDFGSAPFKPVFTTF